jgi:predicted peroxiredoxin
MRGVNTSKCQEAKEIEMKSMNTNEVWETEAIPNGAKIVGCKGSTRRNVTLKGI